MKKLKKAWHRLPVKIQACGNILAVVLCLVLIYIFLGSPVLTVEDAYRRAEKANLVGPGEVLAQLRPEGQEYAHLVLAGDEAGAMLYAWDRWDPELREFLYHERQDGLALMAAPGREHFRLQTHAILPVYLFDDCPGAVRAELELRLSGEYEGEPCERTYALSALREGEGYFAFTIRSSACLGAEGWLLDQLRSATGDSMADTAGTVIRAAVRLYGEEDRLIREKELLLGDRPQ